MLYEILVGPDDQDLAAALLWGLGAIGIEVRSDRLMAGFREQTDLSSLAWTHQAVAAFTEADWVEAQRDAIPVSRVDGWVIHPPWTNPDVGSDERALVIDPGAAFGHGGHPTTSIMLELLGTVALGNRVVGDVGCGTGVLGIAAALRGAARVWATDIDPTARTMTQVNAEANGVCIELVSMPGPADFALVNVTVDIHESIAATIDAETILVSGILAHQVTRVEVAYGRPLRAPLERDGWVGGTLVR